MTTYLGDKPVGIGTVRATMSVGKVITDDKTIIGDGFTEPLAVNTLLFATSESVAASAEAIRTEVNNKFTVVDSAIKGANEAIAKTRDDYIQADSEIHQMLNGLSAETTTIKNNQASLGTQVANIEHKIPDGTTGTNSLINKQILAQTSYTKAEVDAKVSSVYKFKGSVSTYNSLPRAATTGDVYNVTDTGANYAWDGSKWDKLSETIDLTAYATTAYVTAREQDIRSDLGENISEVHTQVVELSGEVAAAISKKQDKLTAGENITIDADGTISATGGGGGTAEYPDQTGNAGKFLVTDGANVSWSNKLTGPLVIYGEKDSSATSSTDVLTLERLNTSTGTISEVTITYSSNALNFGGLGISGVNSLRPSSSSTSSLGSATYKWAYVYAQQIGGLKVPDGVGTIARIEDIDAAVGDISTALTAILGE